MSDKVQCCYCGRELTLKGQTNHQARCPMNPVMTERIQTFIRDYSEENGRITCAEYRKSDERKAQKLPDDVVIFRTFGSWKNFLNWCGVEYVRKHQRMTKREYNERENMARIDAMLERGRIDYESAFDYRAMPACRRYTERYIDLDTGQTHERIVTVLR